MTAKESALRAWAREMSNEEWRRAVAIAYRREGSLRAAGCVLGISHARVLQILREDGEYVRPAGRVKEKSTS